MAVAMVCRVEALTKPEPAALELAGAPMKTLTLGLTEVEVAQLAHEAKLNWPG